MIRYTDAELIASWAKTAVLRLSEAGVLSGDNNEFAPAKEASRAEVAQMFKNFMRFVAY